MWPPAANVMSINPYEPPRFGPEGYSPFQQMGPGEAAARVKLPAVFLLVMSAVTIIGRIAGLCAQFVALGQAEAGPPSAAAMGGIAGNGFALLFNLATLIGA